MVRKAGKAANTRAMLDAAEMRLARALGRAPAGWRSDDWRSAEAKELFALLPETVPTAPTTPARTKPTDVYVCRAADGEVIYVGLSINAGTRASQHRNGSVWWDRVASIEVEKCESRDAACARERELIAALNPSHNRSPGGAA